MNMPGFSADAALYSSGRQYRIGASFWGHAEVVIPQFDSSCLDIRCLAFCRDQVPPFDIFLQDPDISCFDLCSFPCIPEPPPEFLPPPG